MDSRQYMFARASLTAAGSVQLIASASGTRWHLKDGTVSFVHCTVSTLISFYEVGQAVSVCQFKAAAGASSGVFNVPFLVASDKYSSFHLNTSDAGTITALFAYMGM